MLYLNDATVGHLKRAYSSVGVVLKYGRGRYMLSSLYMCSAEAKESSPELMLEEKDGSWV